FRMEHEAAGLYRAWLVIGGAMGMASALLCAWFGRLRGEPARLEMGRPWVLGLVVLIALHWSFALVAAGMWAVLRWTNFKPVYLSPALMLIVGDRKSTRLNSSHVSI